MSDGHYHQRAIDEERARKLRLAIRRGAEELRRYSYESFHGEGSYHADPYVRYVRERGGHASGGVGPC
jgi:hypothetical protein